MSTATLVTEAAWALQNRLNPFPVAGTLRWDGETLSFTIGALAGEAFLGWVETRTGQIDLAARLKAGEEIVAFSWTLAECTVAWPALYAGSAVEVTGTDATSWLIALDYPSGGSLSQTISLFTGRRKGKVWKKALES